MSKETDLKVLLVDHPATRKLVLACLESIGMRNITEVENGTAAWALLYTKGSNFQLVIAEIHMLVGMSGLDLLVHIKSETSLPLQCLPVLLLTVEQRREDIEFARRYGAGYLVKPFSPEMLGEKIRPLMLR